MKLVITISFYNEIHSLASVITEIPKHIAQILEGKADIVLGNRKIGKLDHMPRGE